MTVTTSDTVAAAFKATFTIALILATITGLNCAVARFCHARSVIESTTQTEAVYPPVGHSGIV